MIFGRSQAFGTGRKPPPDSTAAHGVLTRHLQLIAPGIMGCLGGSPLLFAAVWCWWWMLQQEQAGTMLPSSLIRCLWGWGAPPPLLLPLSLPHAQLGGVCVRGAP